MLVIKSISNAKHRSYICIPLNQQRALILAVIYVESDWRPWQPYMIAPSNWVQQHNLMCLMGTLNSNQLVPVIVFQKWCANCQKVTWSFHFFTFWGETASRRTAAVHYSRKTKHGTLLLPYFLHRWTMEVGCSQTPLMTTEHDKGFSSEEWCGKWKWHEALKPFC